MNAATGTGLIRKTPGVCGGEACVGDRRIAVWVLVNARRLGITDQQLLADYPSLTVAELRAAWDYYAAQPAEIDDAIARNEATD
jgi:uncharacterized protein (DUF433 family)